MEIKEKFCYCARDISKELLKYDQDVEMKHKFKKIQAILKQEF